MDPLREFAPRCYVFALWVVLFHENLRLQLKHLRQTYTTNKIKHLNLQTCLQTSAVLHMGRALVIRFMVYFSQVRQNNAVRCFTTSAISHISHFHLNFHVLTNYFGCLDMFYSCENVAHLPKTSVDVSFHLQSDFTLYKQYYTQCVRILCRAKKTHVCVIIKLLTCLFYSLFMLFYETMILMCEMSFMYCKYILKYQRPFSTGSSVDN